MFLIKKQFGSKKMSKFMTANQLFNKKTLKKLKNTIFITFTKLKYIFLFLIKMYGFYMFLYEITMYFHEKTTKYISTL